MLEVTLRTPAALDVIRAMKTVPGAIVGAGTVVNERQLEQRDRSGSRIHRLARPDRRLSVARSSASGVPYLPGVATASDIMRGLDLGLTRFKFFPAEAAGGIPALKALAAPFGEVRFCPTGGISEATAPDWLAFEAVLCVGGSWVVPKGALDLNTVRQAAERASRMGR